MYVNELLSGLWIGDTDILNSKKFMTENSIDIILNYLKLSFRYLTIYGYF